VAFLLCGGQKIVKVFCAKDSAKQGGLPNFEFDADI